MTRRCPACGRSNRPEADFCEECAAFLGWRASAGAAAGLEPARAASRAEAASAAAIGQLSGPDVRILLPGADAAQEGTPLIAVAAGGRATAAVVVRNRSDVVEQYSVAVEGIDPAWWSAGPEVTRLLPFSAVGDDDAEFLLTFMPPREPVATAGDWPVTVVVTPHTAPATAARIPAVLRIEPFAALRAQAEPSRVAGRRARRLGAAVTNAGNAGAVVEVSGRDAEDACRVRTPHDTYALSAGERAAIPVDAVPKRRRWFGRAVHHQLTLEARPAGSPDPGVPFAATYVQRPWIPWWAPLLLLLLVVAAVLAFLLWPSRVEVPDVVGARSAFAAQKQLEAGGLTLNPRVERVRRPKVRAGTVVDQSPRAGDEVEEGAPVTVRVAAGRRRVKVPRVIGLKAAQADVKLRAAGLTLGAVEPRLGAPGVVAEQLPRAGVRSRTGTAVRVVVRPQPAKKGKGGGKKEQEEKKKGEPPATVPAAAGGGGAAAAAAAMEEAGLKPVVELRIDPAPRGTVLATVPAEGEPPPEDGVVKIVASAGFPRVAYDDGVTAKVAGGHAGTPVVGLRRGAAVASAGGWRADGRRVALVSEGILLAGLRPKQRPVPVALGEPGRSATLAAFAPAPAGDLLAFVAGDRLCWTVLRGAAASPPRCRAFPRWEIHALSWSPDGDEMLLAARARPGATSTGFGLIRLRSERPFSAHAPDWRGGGELDTPVRGGRGVLAAAFAPRGRGIALVSNLEGAGDFRLALAEDARKLSKAERQPVQACDVAWRSDGRELLVVQAGATCSGGLGPIVRLDPRRPRVLSTVVLSGRHPSYQPVDLRPVSLRR